GGWAHEEGREQPGQVDRTARLVEPARRRPQRPREAHRRAKQAAALEGVAPVAIDEGASGRGPAVPRWAPDPPPPRRAPGPGPPQVARCTVDPSAGDVETVLVGRRDRRAVVQGGGRGLLVLELVLAGVGPEARRPLPAAVHVGPVARDPAALGRRHAP